MQIFQLCWTIPFILGHSYNTVQMTLFPKGNSFTQLPDKTNYRIWKPCVIIFQTMQVLK